MKIILFILTFLLVTAARSQCHQIETLEEGTSYRYSSNPGRCSYGISLALDGLNCEVDNIAISTSIVEGLRDFTLYCKAPNVHISYGQNVIRVNWTNAFAAHYEVWVWRLGRSRPEEHAAHSSERHMNLPPYPAIRMIQVHAVDVYGNNSASRTIEF